MDAAELIKETRKSLRFKEEVLAHFSFLGEWGFKCVSAELLIVRYISGRVLVFVCHDERSYEIEAKVQYVNGTQSFSITEIFQLLSLPEADTHRLYMTSTPEGVSHGVEVLAGIFKSRLTKEVLNDNTLFIRLEKQSKENIAAWSRQMKIENLRLKMDDAWKTSNYHQIIECAESLSDVTLLKSEIAKITYARKQLAEKRLKRK